MWATLMSSSRFTPLCTTPPIVQFTLLKQHISNKGWSAAVPGQDQGQQMQGHVEVDEKIDFNMHAQSTSSSVSSSSVGSRSDDCKLSVLNSVLDRDFLEKHRAEIVCGPVDLRSNVDLSGHGGIITLSSPQLLKLKSRSYLLHIKALPSLKDPGGRVGKGLQVWHFIIVSIMLETAREVM